MHLSLSIWLAGLVFLGSAGFARGADADATRPDLVIADFEGRDYGDWKVTGTAFGPGPARGTLPNQMPVDGFLGQGLVSSFSGGDDSTGTLTSPPFRIERRYLHFLVGGGKYPSKTCLNLLREGSVVRTATGPNDKPGGSERLEGAQWDVSDLAGQTVTLEIVDQATGSWGHINVDQIVQTDRPPVVRTDVTRELAITKRYLNLPVKQGAAKRRMSVLVDGQVAREFEIELADGAPDFWVFLDLTPFAGKTATLKVDRLPERSDALKLIEQADEIRGASNLYREKLRPQFHFSSRRGWNNDPNGLVFSQGEYHLFYQHNPYGWDWGNMHWGHAVSSNLVQWRELPIALYPRAFGDWVFSGSAVVDTRNTGGFKTGTGDVLVAAFTSTGRGECIAFSNDRGRTWTEPPGNPVVKHEGRDPRLFWHEPTERWVMAVYDEFQGKRYIAFYNSPDLKAWTFQSRIEGFFECPDIFELPVDGDRAKTRWVLTAASSEYMLGQFDGTVFKPETPKLPGHRGEAFYAAQTFSNLPDGRRVQIGWGQMAAPGMPFNQMMTFPCDLTLRTTAEGVRLCWQPVPEIATLREKTRRFEAQSLKPDDNPVAQVAGELFDLQAEFAPGSAETVNLGLGGITVSYDAKQQQLICKDHRAGLKPKDGKIRLRVLLDRTSIEIFGNDGEVFMPIYYALKETNKSLFVFAKGGTATLSALEVHELRPAWVQP